MRLTSASKRSVWASLLFVYASLASAEWTFSNGKAVIVKKGDSIGESTSFSPTSPIPEPLSVSPQESLKLTLSVKEGSEAGRPHQAFVLLTEPESGMETFFPLNVQDSGKAKFDLSHKDIPSYLLSAPSLSLSLVLGSFGTTPGSVTPIGSLTPSLDVVAKAALEKQKVKDLGEGKVVYKRKQEIRHVFRADPKNPPKVITLAFTAAVLGAYLFLFVLWFPILGGNLSHLPKALGAAPISHPIFFFSLLSLEGIFFMYYVKWNLFQTLAAMGVAGPLAFFSGSRALREVRARRERGER
ncbi:hypothetical protein RUND412_005800 [Rhizina undulata]